MEHNSYSNFNLPNLSIHTVNTQCQHFYHENGNRYYGGFSQLFDYLTAVDLLTKSSIMDGRDAHLMPVQAVEKGGVA